MKYEPSTSEQYYHIYNRGNNGEDIFLEDKELLQLLRFNEKVYSTCKDLSGYKYKTMSL